MIETEIETEIKTEIKTGSAEYQKKYYKEKYTDYHRKRYDDNKDIYKEISRKKYLLKRLEKLHDEYLDLINQTVEHFDVNNVDSNMMEHLNQKLKIESKIDKLMKKIK